MQRSTLPILFGILLTSQALQAAPVFQASKTVNLTSGPMELLENCSRLDFMFKECSWKSNYPINNEGVISVPKGFRESPSTSIIVDGHFHKTFGDFRLSIDGVMYPLVDKNGEQAFILPNGTNTSLAISIVSSYVGKQYSETDASALIRSVSLRLDNSALVNSVLSTIKDQSDKVRADTESFKREKRFLRFFSKTDEEIGQIKFNLTGRDAGDLSDDCEKPDRLLPDECQYLQTFNRYLRGEKNEFSEETKTLALQKLTNSNQELGEQIKFLREAKQEVSEAILATYNNTLTFIQGEQTTSVSQPGQ